MRGAGLRLTLLAGVLLAPVTAHAIAFATPPNTAPIAKSTSNGIWTYEPLQSLDGQIWADMDAEQISGAISDAPERLGSRTLNRLVKAVIAAPIVEDGESHDDLTALRLKKLLAMGGIEQAKELAESLSEDHVAPQILDQSIMTLVATGGREAACLDLLAYKSESEEKFAALADETKRLADICVDKSKDPVQAQYTLSQFKELNDLDAALAAWRTSSKIVAGEGLTGVQTFEAVRDMSPFKQSLVMHSPNAALPVQWRMLPFAIRHDLIGMARAEEIYMGASLSGKNIPAADALAKAKNLEAYQRLPLYYKALQSYSSEPAPMADLATDILAAASNYDMYGLLPFVPYLDDLELSTLPSRKAFVAALALGLEGKSPTGDAGLVKPGESPWILTVLAHDQAFSEENFDIWAKAHLDPLLTLAPRLKTRLFLLLDEISGETGKSSAYNAHYDNRKNLTPRENYVMHDVLALSRATEFAQDKAIGQMVIALANADGNISPDLLDPQGMVEMIRLLNDSGLTQSAKTLAMESLVFRMSVKAAAGE